MMMNPFYSVTIMIVVSIFIGYYFSMTILLSKNQTFNLQKTYTSLLMGILMGIVELAMFMIFFSQWFDHRYLILMIILLMFAIGISYLYINQIGVDRSDFLRGMIEHHQMALEMAKKVLPKLKSTDTELITLVKNIDKTQTEEINQMRRLLNQEVTK